MNARSDSSTQELTRLRLKMEDDLIFTPHRYGDTTYYHVELPSRSKFFRIGLAEYTFISLLDGNTTVAEALSLTARSLGRDALNEHDAAAICIWLVETGLAQPARSSQAARLCEADREPRGQGHGRRLNPFWMKFPLGRPDRLLRRLLPLVGWIYSKPAMAVGLLLIGMGAATVATRWDRFAGSAAAVFSPSNWLWLTAGLVAAEDAPRTVARPGLPAVRRRGPRIGDHAASCSARPLRGRDVVVAISFAVATDPHGGGGDVRRVAGGGRRGS